MVTEHLQNSMDQSPFEKLIITQLYYGHRPCVTFRNMLLFYGEQLLAPNQTPSLGLPRVGCPRLLIQYIRSI